MKLILSTLLLASAALAQITHGGITSDGAINFSAATSTRPAKSGTSLPATCTVGEVYFKTDATAGQNVYGCTATNTWTAQGGSGSSGGPTGVNPRYIPLAEEFGVNAAQTGNAVWRSGSTTWYHGGSGSFGASQAGSWPNLGVVRQSSGSGTASHLNQSDIAGSVAWGTLPTTSTWTYYLVFRFPAAADYDSAATTYIGVGGVSGAPPNGFGIRRTGAETNWQLYFKSGDGTQATDSGWSAANTSWHTLKIRADGTTANKVWVSMDGGTEKSICVSGCDANAGAGWWGNPTLNGFYMHQSATSGNTRAVDYDYFGFLATAYTVDGRRQ